MHSQPPGINTKPIPDARLLDIQNQLISVSSGGVLPQGTRVHFEIRPSASEAPVALEGKVVSVRRLEGDRFVIVVRIHSLARAEISALERALPARREDAP